MGTENDDYVYSHSNVALWSVRRGTISLSLRGRLGENSSISYFVKLLETHAQPIEVLAMQIVHKYITKVKNMPNDMKLPKPAWNIRYKVFQNVTERPCMYVCMYIYIKNNRHIDIFVMHL